MEISDERVKSPEEANAVSEAYGHESSRLEGAQQDGTDGCLQDGLSAFHLNDGRPVAKIHPRHDAAEAAGITRWPGLSGYTSA